MASIRVYGREVTLTLDWQSPTDNSSFNRQSSFPVYSFDDFRKYTSVSFAQLGGGAPIKVGRFFTVDVEVPESDELVTLGKSDDKRMRMQDGTFITADDLMKKVDKPVEGYRRINSEYEPEAGS